MASGYGGNWGSNFSKLKMKPKMNDITFLVGLFAGVITLACYLIQLWPEKPQPALKYIQMAESNLVATAKPPYETLTVFPSKVTTLEVGEAKLTKKSVLQLIDALKQARDTQYPTPDQNRRMMAAASKVAKIVPEQDAVELLYSIMDHMGKQVIAAVCVDHEIAKLQKLADALAPEGPAK